MGIFYPGNQQRGDRLQQLMDNVSNMQRTAADEHDRIAQAEDEMMAAFDEIMKAEGVATLDQLMEKIANEMPDDAKEEFKKVIEATRDFDYAQNVILLAGGMIFTTAFTAGTIGNMILYMKAMASIKAVRAYANAIKVLVTQSVSKGLELLKGLRVALKGMAVELKTTTTFGRVVGVVSKVADFLAWLSVGIEIITFIASIIIEKEQRDELIKNIHECLVNRLTVSFYGSQLKKATEHFISVRTYITWRAKYGAENEIIKNMAKSLGKDIHDSMDTVTLEGEIATWNGLDKNVGAYTDDDISNSEVKAKVEEEIKKFEEEVEAASKK